LKRAQGELGIGLALARSLVEMHGGRIAARSGGLNQGSEFVLSLPLSARPVSRETPGEPGGSDAGAGSRQRIVVVDDSQDGADSLAMVLQTMGADPRVAYDGPSALAAVRDFLPELVFLDLGM